MSQLKFKERISRRTVLAGMAAVAPALAIGSRAFAADLNGDELP